MKALVKRFGRNDELGKHSLDSKEYDSTGFRFSYPYKILGYEVLDETNGRLILMNAMHIEIDLGNGDSLCVHYRGPYPTLFLNKVYLESQNNESREDTHNLKLKTTPFSKVATLERSLEETNEYRILIDMDDFSFSVPPILIDGDATFALSTGNISHIIEEVDSSIA